jgi:hypothetical protein
MSVELAPPTSVRPLLLTTTVLVQEAIPHKTHRQSRILEFWPMLLVETSRLPPLLDLRHRGRIQETVDPSRMERARGMGERLHALPREGTVKT